MSKCLNLTPPLLYPAGKADSADCKAFQGNKTTGQATEGTNLVPEQTIHKISTVIVHKKNLIRLLAADRALCQAQYDTSTFSQTT